MRKEKRNVACFLASIMTIMALLIFTGCDQPEIEQVKEPVSVTPDASTPDASTPDASTQDTDVLEPNPSENSTPVVSTPDTDTSDETDPIITPAAEKPDAVENFISNPYGFQVDFPEQPPQPSINDRLVNFNLFVGHDQYSVMIHKYKDGFGPAMPMMLEAAFKSMRTTKLVKVDSEEQVTVGSVTGTKFIGDMQQSNSETIVKKIEMYLPIYDKAKLYRVSYTGTNLEAGKRFVDSFQFIGTPGTWESDDNSPADQ